MSTHKNMLWYSLEKPQGTSNEYPHVFMEILVILKVKHNQTCVNQEPMRKPKPKMVP